MTVAGDLDLSQQSGVFLTVKNGLVLDGTMLLGNAGGSTYGYVYFGVSSAVAQTFSGNANVLMGGNTNNALYNYTSGSGAAGTLTIASTVNVHGKSGILNSLYGTGTIINQGTIAADVAGGTLTVGGTGMVSNQGTLEAKNGATLSLNGTWSNTGAISVTNSTVNLRGSFTGAELGTLTRTGGSVILVGLLTGNLSLDATTGSWNLKGGTLKNGTLSESGGALFGGEGYDRERIEACRRWPAAARAPHDPRKQAHGDTDDPRRRRS